MKVAEACDLLNKVRPGKVKVLLREKEVVAGISDSGLWPRVEILLGDKRKSVPLTQFADIKKEATDENKLSKLDIAVLNLAGIKGTHLRRNPYVKGHLQSATQRIYKSIRSAIKAAQTRKGLGGRQRTAQRKERRKLARGEVLDRLQDVYWRFKLEPGDLTPKQVGELWQQVIDEALVEKVHEH